MTTNITYREELLKHLLANAKVEPLQVICGIYFLFDRGRVVYVGQSKDIYVRVRKHYKDPLKIFDQWAYLECEPDRLAEAEREYIRLFRPCLNKTFMPKDIVPRQPKTPSFIIHRTGIYENITVTDEDRRRCSDYIARIMSGG